MYLFEDVFEEEGDGGGDGGGAGGGAGAGAGGAGAGAGGADAGAGGTGGAGGAGAGAAGADAGGGGAGGAGAGAGGASTPTPRCTEVEGLAALPWYKALAPEVQAQVRDGVKAKWGNLERGYSEKYRKTSEEKKALEAQRAEFEAGRKAAEERVKRAELLEALYGGDDSEAQKLQKELVELRAYRQQAEAARQEAARQEQARMEQEIVRDYADILADDKAGELFERLVSADVDLAEAAEIVRGKFKLAKAETPQQQPKPPTPPTPKRDAWERATEVSNNREAPGTAEAGFPKGYTLEQMIAEAASGAVSKHKR